MKGRPKSFCVLPHFKLQGTLVYLLKLTLWIGCGIHFLVFNIVLNLLSMANIFSLFERMQLGTVIELIKIPRPVCVCNDIW